MTIDPTDIETQVRTQLRQALDAISAEGPAWAPGRPARRTRTTTALRRRATVVALAGLAALALILAVTLPSQRAHRPATLPHIAQLSVMAQRALGATISPPITSGAGSIFAAVWDSGEVLRLDPVTLETTGRLQVGGPRNGPLSVAFGAGSLWLLNFADSSLWRVDPFTMTRTMVVPLRGQPSQVAVGDGSVWVTECCTSTSTADRQMLLRLDPTSGSTTGSAKLPGDGGAVELAVGAAVVVSSENAPVQVLDPHSLTLLHTLPTGCVPCSAAAITADTASIYVAATDGVRRYQVASSQPLSTYSDSAEVTALTADEGTLWAASTDGLVGLDLETLAVVTTRQPLKGPAAAFSFNGAVYASVYGGIVRMSTTG